MKTWNLLTLFFSAALLTSAVPAAAIEVAFEENRQVPLVYVNVAVKAGAASDPVGQSGLTNFLGEMFLRGSSSRTKEQIDLEIDQMGAKIDVETRAEALIIRGAVLKSQLEPFLKLVQEILTQPSFPEREIAKLKAEIISGILEETGRDQSLSGRKFTEFLFQGHPYGKPVLGKAKDVEKLTSAQLRAHYDRVIRDGLLLVVGTGDASRDQIRQWADGLGSARSGLGEVPRVALPEDASSRRLLLIDKPERTQTQINFGQIGLRPTDPAWFPLHVGNHAFGGGSFLARLMVEIRVKRGWSYGANSYFRIGREPRSWQVHLFPAAKDTVAALGHSLKMVEELREKGITQAEFDQAKLSIVNSAGFMYNTSKKRVENTLIERTLDLPDGFMKTYGPESAKVTLEQVNAALRKFLQPDRLSISVLCTAKDLRQDLARAAGVAEKALTVLPYTAE